MVLEENELKLKLEINCQQEEGKIEVKLTANSYEVILRVKDPGSGFDWENVDFSLPLLAEKSRGLGMIDKAADEIYFNERGNIIKVYFRAR